ncbi:MAG TPA: type II secretion system F family protein [Blastocatellia bacterium]|nr:type II secretion system F family protein [Blastocatellia bacterium]
MDFMIPFSVFVFVMIVVIGGYLVFFHKPDVAAARLEQLVQPDNAKLQGKSETDLAKIAQQVAEPLDKLVPISAEKAKHLQKKLMHAGYHSPNATMIYRAIQLAALIGLPLVVFLFWLTTGWALSDSYRYLMGAVFLGYVIPRQTLDNMVKGRQQRLRWGLADALDLMVVSIEAGLGLNAAMVRVGQEMKKVHPDISREFELVNLEIQVGREREVAFRNLAERTGVDDLRNFCAILIQADRFGTSVARAVRVYSDSLRTKRRQRAEQAAQKAAVKLLMPLALFLFPTLFIVILGPAAIQLMRNFVNR